MNSTYRERIHERILQAKDECYGDNGRNASNKLEGDFGTWQDWEDLIVELTEALIQEVAKSAKPEKKKDAEYVSMYSYDYVNDGNLDDLCGYVADKSSDWGYNQAIDQYEQNIKELLGGSDGERF